MWNAFPESDGLWWNSEIARSPTRNFFYRIPNMSQRVVSLVSNALFLFTIQMPCIMCWISVRVGNNENYLSRNTVRHERTSTPGLNLIFSEWNEIKLPFATTVPRAARPERQQIGVQSASEFYALLGKYDKASSCAWRPTIMGGEDVAREKP